MENTKKTVTLNANLVALAEALRIPATGYAKMGEFWDAVNAEKRRRALATIETHKTAGTLTKAILDELAEAKAISQKEVDKYITIIMDTKAEIIDIDARVAKRSLEIKKMQLENKNDRNLRKEKCATVRDVQASKKSSEMDIKAVNAATREANAFLKTLGK